MNSFNCSACGIAHDHSTDKHVVDDAFDLPDDWVDDMVWGRYCNCGFHEVYAAVQSGDLPNVDEDQAEREARKRVIPNHIRDQIYAGTQTHPLSG